MKILDKITRIFASDGYPAGPGDDFWYQPVGQMNSANQRVSVDSAMTVAAVYACVRVLAETVASLPLKIYRFLPDGGKAEDKSNPLYNILHHRPNTWQTSMEWREMMMASVVLRGNAYSEIRYDRSGAVSELCPLTTDNVAVEQLDNGRLRYNYRLPTGQPRIFLQDEIFHLRGLSMCGPVGISPLSYAREVIGAALATQGYGARLFSNDARPGGILEHPGKIGADAAARLKQSWSSAHSGVGNSHKVAVLEEGMSFKPISMSAEDSQFLQTRKFQVSEIARIFRVPPHMIGDLERATFSNIEQQSIGFVRDTIRPWLVRWEQAISRDLIQDPETNFAEFSVDALLRGDIASRYAAYAVGRINGWLSANEIRSLENMNPIEEGDDYLIPLNMTQAGADPADVQEDLTPEPADEPQPEEDG